MKHEDHQPKPFSDDCDECNERATMVRELFASLGIPIKESTNMKGNLSTDITVKNYDLYDVLTDQTKLKTLLS